MNINRSLPYFFLLLISTYACCDKKDEPGLSTGKVSFTFSHEVNGAPLVFDSLKYINAAGNHYMINGIQYFVSNVMLYKNGGSPYKIKDKDYTHYIDAYPSNTSVWQVPDDILAGSYDSLSFILGLDQQLNKTGYFVNPPEVDMFWPDVMGGGYHYMKMDGKWLNPGGQVYPFNFHLGRSMEVNGNDTTFYQNYVKISLPGSAFVVKENATTKIAIKMNVDSWFKTPHVWNIDSIGPSVMTNQSAMNWAKENGWDVFSMSILP